MFIQEIYPELLVKYWIDLSLVLHGFCLIMRRKQWVIIGLLFSLVLIGIGNWIGCKDLFVSGWIKGAQWYLKGREVFNFRLEKVDSLYDAKEYCYFLFVRESADFHLNDEVQDSLLVLTADHVTVLPGHQDVDKISLSGSAFDFLMKPNLVITLFRVVHVTKEKNGYLYRLERMK